MGRPSTILQLSQRAREELDRWLDDPAITQTEAAARVNALLAALHPGRPPVSRMAVNRYHLQRRAIGSYRAESREIAAGIRFGTVRSARKAGRAMGRLIARSLPAEVRMHCLAALAAELSRTSPIGESPEGSK